MNNNNNNNKNHPFSFLGTSTPEFSFLFTPPNPTNHTGNATSGTMDNTTNNNNNSNDDGGGLFPLPSTIPPPPSDGIDLSGSNPTAVLPSAGCSNLPTTVSSSGGPKIGPKVEEDVAGTMNDTTNTITNNNNNKATPITANGFDFGGLKSTPVEVVGTGFKFSDVKRTDEEDPHPVDTKVPATGTPNFNLFAPTKETSTDSVPAPSPSLTGHTGDLKTRTEELEERKLDEGKRIREEQEEPDSCKKARVQEAPWWSIGDDQESVDELFKDCASEEVAAVCFAKLNFLFANKWKQTQVAVDVNNEASTMIVEKAKKFVWIKKEEDGILDTFKKLRNSFKCRWINIGHNVHYRRDPTVKDRPKEVQIWDVHRSKDHGLRYKFKFVDDDGSLKDDWLSDWVSCGCIEPVRVYGDRSNYQESD